MGGGGAAVSPAAWPCGRARAFAFGVHGRTPWPRSQRPPLCTVVVGQYQPATSPEPTMDVHMPWTFSACTGTWLGGMTTNQGAIRNKRSPPPPSCRRQSRLARASFSGSAIKVISPIRPLCAHVEAHNLRGCGKPRKLRRGPAGRGRAGVPERGERCAGGVFVFSGISGGQRVWRVRRGLGCWMPRRGFGGRGRRGRGLFSGAPVRSRA